MSGDPTLLRKLMAKAKPSASGCIEWAGWRMAAGYGSMYHRGRSQPTHRLAYMAAKGPIPDGLFVLHSCDNPPCINPDHLSVGTNKDNILQCIERGRHFWTEKTHCKRGHELAGENVYVAVGGRRHCKVCSRARQRMALGWPEDLAYSVPRKQGWPPNDLVRVKPKATRPRESTHCGKGHELSGANRYVNPRGYVNCRRCQQDARIRFVARRSSVFDGEANER